MKSRLLAIVLIGWGTMVLCMTNNGVLAEELGIDDLEEKYPVLAAFKDVQLHGFIDTGINYNFNNPDSRSNSDLRVFDRKANSFTLNMVEISLEKELKDSFGYRLDLNFGKDANITAPADTGAGDEFDIQEAFITLRAPVGEGMDFKFGKFVTLLGAEVIESPLNYNYSRSFLFGLAIPFTHTGVLGSYSFNDKFSLSAGIVNGWDVIEDNNNAKTFLGNITISPYDSFSLGVNGVYGAEQDDNDSSKRGVLDVVATLTPINDVTLVLNYDYGREEDAGGGGQDAKWTGLAGYIHYDVSDTTGLTLRSEFFDDEDGVRTGTAQELWEITLTAEFKLYEGVMARLEYRHDESNQKPFIDGSGLATDNQDTIAFELVYTF